jgi:hypothetical protein
MQEENTLFCIKEAEWLDQEIRLHIYVTTKHIKHHEGQCIRMYAIVEECWNPPSWVMAVCVCVCVCVCACVRVRVCDVPRCTARSLAVLFGRFGRVSVWHTKQWPWDATDTLPWPGDTTRTSPLCDSSVLVNSCLEIHWRNCPYHGKPTSLGQRAKHAVMGCFEVRTWKNNNNWCT